MTNSIFLTFIGWYYAETPINILRTGENFIQWSWHFFSIRYLLRRILWPWHKDITPYGRGFDFGRYARIFSWNLISRVLGAVLRISVVIFGLAAQVVIVVLTIVICVLWLILPLIILLLLIIGVANL